MEDMPKIKPLTKEEVRSVIKGNSCAKRVPINIHFWVNIETFGSRIKQVHEILSRYPIDIQIIPFNMPNKFKENEKRWSWVPFEDPNKGKQVAIDNAGVIESWEQLDDIFNHFPDPNHPELFKDLKTFDGRYRLAHWWYFLFERHWEMCGMTNALMDFYTQPDEVHKMFRKFTNFYLKIIERAAKEQNCDGIWTSDDIGTQTGQFFSVDIFREFFKPYYAEIIDCTHSYGMDFWLHTCGNVEPFIPDLIEIGLDVLHPIQKHTMDEKKINEQFGERLTIFAGLDVQHTLPWGTPEDVRSEVRFLLDTFYKQGKGLCMLTAGNGINQDCSLENLEVFFDEAFNYGEQIVQTEEFNEN